MKLKEGYYEEAIELVREAGDEAARFWGDIHPHEVKTDGLGDVVTKHDKEIEAALVRKLKLLTPGFGVLGEEFGANGSGEKTWLIDPIDGTLLFTRGMSGCTSMLALTTQTEVVFATIYDFVNKKMYVAEKGGGAFRNGEPIHVSNKPLNQAMLSFETHLKTPEALDKYQRLSQRAVVFHHINSGSEFGLAAEGKVEGKITLDPFGEDWDFAPGTLLVAEAGGIVKNIGSNRFDFRNHEFLAVNEPVFETLTQGEDALFPVKD